MLVGTDLVDLVKALGLEELVDLGTGKASKDFLGEGMVDLLACSQLGLSVGDACLLGFSVWYGYSLTYPRSSSCPRTP